MTVRNSFAGLPPFLFGDGGLYNQLVCDVRTYVRAVDGDSRELLAPMLAWSPGPPAIGDTGDNSPGHMMGTTWLLQVCPDGSWVLYQEARGRLTVVPFDDPPDNVTATARRVSLCFDQSARVVLAWEDQGVIKVRRWDPAENEYIENVSFSGVDPVVVFDAQWAYRVPDSDVLLFYLSSDRERVMCRVQRDVYAVEYEIWDYGGGGGGYNYEIFTSPGTWDWAAAGSPSLVDVLVVAGGGGGGSFGGFTNGGGGGGAGGVRIETNVAVSGNETVTVGAGGAGGSSGTGGAGGNSSFGAITAAGGGGGEGHTGSAYTNPGTGGSGGGAAGSAAIRSGAAGTSGQGHAGGGGAAQAGNHRPGAGGGGADAVGVSTTAAGPGGDGGAGFDLSTIGWGDAVTEGAPAAVGGGGGGGSFNTSAGAGGFGGGGAGSNSGAGNAGTVNTGGGGGGGGNSPGAAGGAGGSGLVVVRWETGGGGGSQSVILDRVIALPYKYQVLVSDAAGVPLPQMLISELYPIALSTGVELAPEFLVGEYRQVAYEYAPSLGVELTPEFVAGALTLPVTTYSPSLGVELTPAFHAGELKDVVTQYQPSLGVQLEPEFHAGELADIGVPYTPTLGVELTPEFSGGVYEPG